MTIRRSGACPVLAGCRIIVSVDARDAVASGAAGRTADENRLDHALADARSRGGSSPGSSRAASAAGVQWK